MKAIVNKVYENKTKTGTLYWGIELDNSDKLSVWNVDLMKGLVPGVAIEYTYELNAGFKNAKTIEVTGKAPELDSTNGNRIDVKVALMEQCIAHAQKLTGTTIKETPDIVRVANSLFIELNKRY